MAQISISAEQFPDIVEAYLLECIRRRKDLPFENPLFEKLLQKMYNSGLQANLLVTYMNMDGNERVRYRLIRKALFNEGVSSSLIRVESTEAVPEE